MVLATCSEARLKKAVMGRAGGGVLKKTFDFIFRRIRAVSR